MYNDFAEVYDKLQDVDYNAFVDYYERIFEKFGKKPKLILDLACGTGNITIPMAKRGYDMIGLDLSCEMLNIAREKAAAEGLDILFLNQDMTEMELYGTVDAIVCALDGLNYITDPDDLKQVFKLVKNYLNPDGIMIFDINSEHKLREILGGNTFVNEEQGIYYVWQSEFDEETGICDFELNFFCEQPDGSYIRFDEFQSEKAYKVEEITDISASTDLDVIGIYKPFEFSTPDDKEERIFFVISPKIC
ncbi:MAG: class I SAM-dependent methyltransferase [Ruminococcaceae bacterium]|nr:class I SAM-dependent methyltransferase [Oscillospiraceae bacterium]